VTPSAKTSSQEIVVIANLPELESGIFASTMKHFAGIAGVGDEIAFPGNGPIPARHPRTLILNAEADPLRASGDLYARQLLAADVPVEVEHIPGSQHGFLNEPESVKAQ
jgi:acetyl esterase/lipase